LAIRMPLLKRSVRLIFLSCLWMRKDTHSGNCGRDLDKMSFQTRRSVFGSSF
jgi:hypothetical protein